MRLGGGAPSSEKDERRSASEWGWGPTSGEKKMTQTLLKPAIATTALVLLVAAAPIQDARPAFGVGSATARRGEVAYGELRVPRAQDAAASIPVAVIHGAKPGKVVAFVAGSHGTEYASSVALSRLIAQIDPAKLSGTVIVLPLLNVASFEQMTVHVNPIDGKGMNANYPGSSSGTQTQRALALVSSAVVEPADVIVDLHGGDLDEDLRPFSYWIRTGDQAQDDASRALSQWRSASTTSSCATST